MIHINFLLYIISFATAMVSVTVSTLFYFQYGKKVVKYYSVFLILITLLLISKMLQCYLDISTFPHKESLLFISLLIQKIAYAACILFGPYFSYNLMGITLTKTKKIIFLVIGLIYICVTIIEIALGPCEASTIIRLCVGLPILFGSFIYHLTLGAIHLGKLGSKVLNIALKIFFILSIIVFPFSLFQYFTLTPYLPNYLEIPISFLILNILTILFSIKYFNQPAFLEDNKISDYFRKKFNITSRESDIIELVIQGCSNIDIGEKLFISPRTVESHLYKIFQKAAIKNRTQLINLILSNQK